MPDGLVGNPRESGFAIGDEEGCFDAIGIEGDGAESFRVECGACGTGGDAGNFISAVRDECQAFFEEVTEVFPVLRGSECQRKDIMSGLHGGGLRGVGGGAGGSFLIDVSLAWIENGVDGIVNGEETDGLDPAGKNAIRAQAAKVAFGDVVPCDDGITDFLAGLLDG